MAWTTGMITQNGNTTVTWKISGGSLSSHDCVVVRHVSGSSGIKITSKTIYLYPNRYYVTTQVVGSKAVAFRFSAERMN